MGSIASFASTTRQAGKQPPPLPTISKRWTAGQVQPVARANALPKTTTKPGPVRRKGPDRKKSRRQGPRSPKRPRRNPPKRGPPKSWLLNRSRRPRPAGQSRPKAANPKNQNNAQGAITTLRFSSSGFWQPSLASQRLLPVLLAAARLHPQALLDRVGLLLPART